MFQIGLKKLLNGIFDSFTTYRKIIIMYSISCVFILGSVQLKNIHKNLIGHIISINNENTVSILTNSNIIFYHDLSIIDYNNPRIGDEVYFDNKWTKCSYNFYLLSCISFIIGAILVFISGIMLGKILKIREYENT